MSTISIAQLQKQVAELQAKLKEAKSPKSRTTIKMTDKGGLYISLPSFKARSEKKEKDYQFGINIHNYQVQGFIESLIDGSLLKAITDYNDSLTEKAE